jgi:hypothetical protein
VRAAGVESSASVAVLGAKTLSRWPFFFLGRGLGAIHDFLVTQSSVEVFQDTELSKDDRPLWVALGAFDLAVVSNEHGRADAAVRGAGSADQAG